MALHSQRVRRFMQKANQQLPTTPTIPDPKVLALRVNLIWEEFLEFLGAAGYDFAESYGNPTPEPDPELQVDLVGMADGLADLSVVVVGSMLAFGIEPEALLELVDRNNLAKFGPGHTLREDGKLIKPPGHQPPDIAGLLCDLSNKTEVDEDLSIPEAGEIWKNIKTGDLYMVEAWANDASNSGDGCAMTIYCNATGISYVRPMYEFMKKFKRFTTGERFTEEDWRTKLRSILENVCGGPAEALMNVSNLDHLAFTLKPDTVLELMRVAGGGWAMLAKLLRMHASPVTGSDAWRRSKDQDHG